MNVAIVVNAGVTDSGLAIALDVLRATNRLCRHGGRREPFKVQVCAHERRSVAAASGLRLGNLAPLTSARRADVVIATGCWLELDAEVEAWLASSACHRTAQLVADVHSRRRLVLGSCTGTLALAQAGILDGREATTAWWLARPFARAFPRVRLDPTQALIAHERVATAGAVLAQADLSLYLVRRVVGPEVASEVTRYLLLDRHAAQAPYMAMSQLVTDDPLLRDAERWIRAHLAQDFALPALTRALGTSSRTFARRVQASLATSPGRWIRRLRVEEAARLLETTALPVERVAELAGLGSAATLRRDVRRDLGMSPREVRARARGLATGDRQARRGRAGALAPR